MPVAKEPFDASVYIKKIHDKHPERTEERGVPSVERQADIAKLVAYNGLWLILTYGSSLLSMLAPWLGTGFNWMVKLRFKNKWEQK